LVAVFAEVTVGARIAPNDNAQCRALRQQGIRLAPPTFKKKGRCRDSFSVANDKFSLSGKTVRLPKVGEVAMTEELRFAGKILGATVSRTADRWFVAIQVEGSDAQCYWRRTSHEVNGVDLELKAAATISTGEVIEAPKPLNAALRRLNIRSRCLSRKLQAAKEAAGWGRRACLPKGTRLPVSNNRQKSAATLARAPCPHCQSPSGFHPQAHHSALPRKPSVRDRGWKRQRDAGQ
jgi:putative transposase